MSDETKPPGWVDRLTGVSREDWDDSNSSTVAQLMEQPAPWTWDSLANSLRDANDNLVLWVAEAGSDMQLGHELVIGAESNRTRALIAAAPEMEALLREVQWNGRGHQQCPFCVGHRHPSGMQGDTDFGHRPGCVLAALLARIDAAKAGT